MEKKLIGRICFDKPANGYLYHRLLHSECGVYVQVFIVSGLVVEEAARQDVGIDCVESAWCFSYSLGVVNSTFPDCFINLDRTYQLYILLTEYFVDKICLVTKVMEMKP